MSHQDADVRALMRAAKTMSASIKHLRAGGMPSFAERMDALLTGVKMELGRRLEAAAIERRKNGKP